MSIASPVLQAWIKRMEREALGLDFGDPEDRAAFRQRISMAMTHTRCELIRDLASHWGKSVPGNASRYTAIRAALVLHSPPLAKGNLS